MLKHRQREGGLRPGVSLGLEGGAFINEEYAAGRGGGFVRLNLREVEMTLSGFSGIISKTNRAAIGVYRAF